MTLNMMAFGVLVPIIVTRDPESGDVLVIDGRQRVRHALEANRRLAEQGRDLLLVPATTRKGDNDATLMGMTIATNELRQADDPLVRAAKMQRLKNLGQDDAAVAVAFGCNTKTVTNTLALLDCNKVAQKAITQGFIGIGDALYLSRLTPAQQTAKVEEIVKATVGKEGHARAKAKRAVLATAASPGDKSAAPKMMGRKEIAAKLKEISECGPLDASERKGWREALEWALGSAPAEPEKDTKTTDMFDASKAAETVA
jgi:ParB family chromosome partitioning protein